MSTVKKTKGTVKKPAVKKKAAAAAAPVAAHAAASDNGHDGAEGSGVRRRDFIHIAAVSFAGVGAAAVALFPGGIGAYPMWVTQVLLIYGVTFKGFGIYIWVVQTSLLIILGLLSLFLIQRQPKRIQRK